MQGKKIISGFLSLLSALIFIMIILLTSIQLNAFNLDFFRSEYKQLETAKVIGMSDQDLMVTTQELLDYIKGERSDLKIQANIKGEERQVFNQREIDHMVDVQKLFVNGFWLRSIGIVILILLLGILFYLTGPKFPKYWAGGYLVGAAIFIVLLGAIGIAISRDFLWFWDNFHYLIFTNDLWILNPETDVLIQMVPEKFFFDLVIRIIASFAAVIMILAVLSGMLLRARKS